MLPSHVRSTRLGSCSRWLIKKMQRQLACLVGWIPFSSLRSYLSFLTGVRGRCGFPELVSGTKTCATNILLIKSSVSIIFSLNWLSRLVLSAAGADRATVRQLAVQPHAPACVSTAFTLGKWEKIVGVKQGFKVGSQAVSGAPCLLMESKSKDL